MEHGKAIGFHERESHEDRVWVDEVEGGSVTPTAAGDRYRRVGSAKSRLRERFAGSGGGRG